MFCLFFLPVFLFHDLSLSDFYLLFPPIYLSVCLFLLFVHFRPSALAPTIRPSVRRCLPACSPYLRFPARCPDNLPSPHLCPSATPSPRRVVRVCRWGGGGSHTHTPLRKRNASRGQQLTAGTAPGPRGACYRGSVRREPGGVRGIGRYGFGVGHPDRERALPDLRPLRRDTLAPVRSGAANY